MAEERRYPVRVEGQVWIAMDDGVRLGATLYVPDGAMAVWRTQDRGASWTALRDGLPQSHAYLGVLREAMARDALEPFGLYVGTSTGQLFVSADEGERWRLAADYLPPIWSVETALVDA